MYLSCLNIPVIQTIRIIDEAICEIIIKRFSQKRENEVDFEVFVLICIALKKMPVTYPAKMAIKTANRRSIARGKMNSESGTEIKSAKIGGLELQISYVNTNASIRAIRV